MAGRKPAQRREARRRPGFRFRFPRLHLRATSPYLLFIARGYGAEALPDPAHQLVADVAIGVEPLLAVTLGDGGIGGRPVFDVEGERAGEVERLVVGLRRERDDEIEVEAFEVFEFLEGRDDGAGVGLAVGPAPVSLAAYADAGAVTVTALAFLFALLLGIARSRRR
jgi:hypothetical protein